MPDTRVLDARSPVFVSDIAELGDRAMKLALEKLANEISVQRSEYTHPETKHEARHACLKYPRPRVVQKRVHVQTFSRGDITYTYYEFEL